MDSASKKEDLKTVWFCLTVSHASAASDDSVEPLHMLFLQPGCPSPPGPSDKFLFYLRNLI